MLRRLISSFTAIALIAAGLSVIEAAPVQAATSYGTVTGTVSFAAAPSWNTEPKNFVVRLVDSRGHQVSTSFVPISYDYDGAGGYTITYPNSENYYNDYFRLSNPYTVKILPSNAAYPQVYLGGSVELEGATMLDLSLPTSHTAAGSTVVPIAASISGTLTYPGAVPSGGVKVIVYETTSGETNGEADVGFDGKYHLVGLPAGNYKVGFIPSDLDAGPGAGVWWSTKTSLLDAGVVTVTTGQQRTGINQTLPAGGIVTGRLVDSQGRVVRGAVAIYSATGASDSIETLVQEKWVEADGTYAFWGLPNGKYRIGFNTGFYPPTNSSLELFNLDGSRYVNSARVVNVDPGQGGATIPDGTLATSVYPYTSAWHTASAATYGTAKIVTVAASVPMVGNVNGVLPLAPEFVAWQERERISGSNASEKDVTCACADPVDTLSGEFYESTADLALPGVGVPVQLDRSYSSSLSSVDGPFGYGSSSSLSTRLEEVPSSEEERYGTVVITQESGATVTFATLVPRQRYVAPSRVNATLTYDWYDDQWVFTRNSVEEFRFTQTGDLLSHQDLHGNIVTFTTEDEQVTSINGSGGRSIAIGWDGDHISTATDSAGRTVSYTYSGSELTSVTAADGRVTAFDHDGNHRVTTITAPGGGVTTNSYDTTGRITNQTDAVGRTTSFLYSGDAADSTTTVTNPAGVATKFRYVTGALVSRIEAFGTSSAITTTMSYDAALNLTKQVDGLGKATIMTYDDAGNMLTSTDPLGHTTTYQYDGLHNVVSVTDPLGRVATATYDLSGSKTSASSPGGATTTWLNNANGIPAASIDPLGNTASYGYDPAGLLTSTTDPLDRTTTTVYDAAGHPIATTDASGATSTVTADQLGRPTTTTDAVGNVTTYEYDDNGNPSKVIDPDGKVTMTVFNLGNEAVSQTDALGQTTTATYTTLGKQATSTDPLGGITTTAYDLLGRPTAVTNPKNLKTTTTYNKNGQVLSVRTPAGNITKASYDAAGRKITSTDPLGNVTTFAYDAANQLVSVTDPLGRVTTSAHDADGRLTTETGPDGHSQTTAFDVVGREIGFTDADGNPTNYSYDPAGQITSRVAPGGLVTSYSYDAAGRVSILTKPDGSTISNQYSAVGQLESATPSLGTASEYTYDPVGRRASMTDESGVTSYEYSGVGQLTSVTNGAGQSLIYGYDAGGRTTTVVYPGGRNVTYAYDAAGRMTTLTDWANRKFTFTWTADGLPSKISNPNKVATTTTYNRNSQITAVSVAKTSTPAATLASYQYGYDAGSQLTSTTLVDPLHTTSGGDTTTYGYDPRQQLTSVSTGGAYGATPGGALLQTPGSSITYNAAQQATAIESSTSALRSDFTYDSNGARASETTSNPAGTTSTSFAHSWQGSLASVTTPSSAVSYTSNGDGLRQSRTEGGSTRQWLWDPSTKLPLLLSDGTSTYLYGPASTPVAEVDSAGTIHYLHADNVGSVRMVTNSAAAAIGTVTYSAYGLVTTAGTSSRFGYAQAWTDPITELNYLRAREYDPAVGQFLQVDPAVNQTRQPYAYAANSPLRFNDPTGLCAATGGPANSFCTADDFQWGASFLTTSDAIQFGDILKSSSSGLFGVADAASFGLTRDIRRGLGVECQFTMNQFQYNVGYGFGTAGSFVAGGYVVARASESILAAGNLFRSAQGAIPGAVNEGIYVIRTTTGSYVGQSGNIAQRFESHLGRFTAEQLAAAERISVVNGKTAREVAEQLMIDASGGVGNLLNRVNPIGQARLNLMPPGYMR